MSGGESHLESTESEARERADNREAAKPKRGRGRELPRTRQLRWCGSALYCTTAKAGHDCMGRVRVRESGTPLNLDEGPITPLRQAQQADRVNIDKIRVHTLIRR